jgi:hypothetical protein
MHNHGVDRDEIRRRTAAYRHKRVDELRLILKQWVALSADAPELELVRTALDALLALEGIDPKKIPPDRYRKAINKLRDDVVNLSTALVSQSDGNMITSYSTGNIVTLIP